MRRTVPMVILAVACGTSPEDAFDTGALATVDTDAVDADSDVADDSDTDAAGDSDTLVHTGPADTEAFTWDSAPLDTGLVEPGTATWTVVSTTFSSSCSPCHLGPAPPNGSLDLDGGRAAVVSVPSAQLPTMVLVDPGSPSTSYLWRKLRGSQREVGGFGRRMPLSTPQLDDRNLALVRAWIRAGAPE